MVADSVYDSNFEIHELETKQGIHAVVAVQDPLRISTNYLQTRQRQRTRQQKLRRMEELLTPQAKALMSKRKCTVETVFGTIKHNMRFKEFRLRGWKNVATEWNLIGAAFNVKRLKSLMG